MNYLKRILILYPILLFNFHQLIAQDVLDLLNTADSLLAEGKITESIQYYEKVIKTEPKHFIAYNNMAIAWLSAKDYEQGMTLLKKSVEINPEYQKGFENLADVLMQLEKFAEAIEYYTQFLKLDPKNDQAFNNRGFCKLNLGKYTEAIPDFDQTLALNPQNSTALSNRAYCQLKLGKSELACQDWQKAAEMGNEDAKQFYEVECNQQAPSITWAGKELADKSTVEGNANTELLVSGLKPYSKIKIGLSKSKGTNLLIYSSKTTSNSSTSISTNGNGDAKLTFGSMIEKSGNYDAFVQFVTRDGEAQIISFRLKAKK
jgi:tetratricopeptide (TPR) repeat protein